MNILQTSGIELYLINPHFSERNFLSAITNKTTPQKLTETVIKKNGLMEPCLLCSAQ